MQAFSSTFSGKIVLEAAELLEAAGKTHSDNRALLWAQAADLYADTGKSSRAIGLLSQLTNDEPELLGCRRQLAEILNESGRRFDANEHLRYLASRTTLTPRELTALINPSLTWVDFSQKPDIDDNKLISEKGLLNVVAALRANGDVRSALTVLQNSPGLANEAPEFVAMHGWLLALNQRFEELTTWVASTNTQCERYPAFWLAIGNLWLHEKRQLSEQCFIEALSREPGSREAVRGLIESAQGEQSPQLNALRERQMLLEESLALAQAITASPKSGWQLAGDMGRVMNAMGRYAESLAWQETLIANHSNSSSQLKIIADHKTAILNKFPLGLDLDLVTCGAAESKTAESKTAETYALLKQMRAGSSPTPPTSLANHIPVKNRSVRVPSFTNVTNTAGIDHQHQNAKSIVGENFRLYEALGSGVACLDYDKDGSVDLYLGQAGCDPPDGVSKLSNQLYRNTDQRFTNQTSRSESEDYNYTHGVTSGDWNQDGFPDLLIANIGVNRLLLNQGDGTFADVTSSAAKTDASWLEPKLTLSMGIADLDGDAIPDIFETNYVDDPRVFNPIQLRPDGTAVSLPGPKHFTAAKDRLFTTTPTAELVTQTIGDGVANESTGLGLLITDLDNDRQNEIFVANDQNANQLWKRDKQGDWTNQAVQRGCAFGPGGAPFACMGIAAADFDHNGRIDLHITNFIKEPSNLYLQNESGLFRDYAVPYRLDELTLPMVGFGTQAFDYDNNSTIDLAIGNGHIEKFAQKNESFQMPPQILTITSDGFSQASVEGDGYWQTKHLARSLVILDWNRDGRVDLAVTNLLEDFALLENRTDKTGAYLHLELIGTVSERDAIGAHVTIKTSEGSFTQSMQAGDGYLGKNEMALFFGLGNASKIDSIKIRWPSGHDQSIVDMAVNKRVTVTEGQSPFMQK